MTLIDVGIISIGMLNSLSNIFIKEEQLIDVGGTTGRCHLTTIDDGVFGVMISDLAKSVKLAEASIIGVSVRAWLFALPVVIVVGVDTCDADILGVLADVFLLAVTGAFAEAFIDVISLVAGSDFLILELSVQFFSD